MTLAKASELSVGLVAAFAIGVWASPHIRPAASAAPQVSVAAPASAATTQTARPAAHHTVASRAVVALPASSDAVEQQAKPLLNRGSDMTKASHGFASAEQFMTVAHAAHNTGIPFVVLKHRVVNERRSLSAAIHASNPTLDAALQVNRARAEARADLVDVAS